MGALCSFCGLLISLNDGRLHYLDNKCSRNDPATGAAPPPARGAGGHLGVLADLCREIILVLGMGPSGAGGPSGR